MCIGEHLNSRGWFEILLKQILCTYQYEVLEQKNRIAPNTPDTTGGNWVEEEDKLQLYVPCGYRWYTHCKFCLVPSNSIKSYSIPKHGYNCTTNKMLDPWSLRSTVPNESPHPHLLQWKAQLKSRGHIRSAPHFPNLCHQLVWYETWISSYMIYMDQRNITRWHEAYMVRTTECVASVDPEYRDAGVQLNAHRLKVPESPEKMHGKSPINLKVLMDNHL